jgi:hypothetical protein
VVQARSILLLCDDSRGHAGNVLEHIAGLKRFSQHRVYSFNPLDRPRSSALLDLREFDAIVVHYTIYVPSDRYLPAALRERLARFRGLKIQFIQDEYRRVDDVTAAIRELGIDLLYTCMPSTVAADVYGPRLPGVETVTSLPGYAPEGKPPLALLPLAQRPLDVGYRGRELPFWLGRLAHEKVEIGERFLARCAGLDLRCDVSSRESDRIYGRNWIRFLASCRATLGTESGASIVDFDGSVETKTRRYLVRNPKATFAEVEKAVLTPYEDNARIAVASPRLFEAAAASTALIMFPGDYSGVVEPWTHYLPLERDFSNLDEIVALLRDAPSLTALVERAYDHVIGSGSFSLRRFVAESFDKVVEDRAPAKSPTRKPKFEQARRRGRAPVPRGHSRMREAAGSALMPLAALYVIARDGVVRRLAATSLRRGLFSGGDLWRLAALRRDGSGVGASLERDGQLLVFTSGADRSGMSPRVVRKAAFDGTLEQIVWDHSDLGPIVPLLPSGHFRVHLGRHGVDGAYSFASLALLARSDPDAVATALEPLLRGSSGTIEEPPPENV